MRKSCFTLLSLLLLFFSVSGQNNVGINDNNSAPKASAMLDVYSTTKGMLIPRIALTSTTSASPVTSPEASLLIYNTATAGDVTPGYYYWNGSSKWVRLVGSADPEKVSNPVTKSANATLLKTENMVFASGDITLTLPAITSADDGLQITVKNVGTYTDLVTIIPQSNHTIDALTAANLTRWKGRTFVAKNSNWLVREKDARTDNFLDVTSDGSFTTLAEAVAFMDLHMSGPTVVRLSGPDTIESTLTINLPYPVTFQGTSFGVATIVAGSGVSGSPMFDCQSDTYFKMLIFEGSSSGAGNDAIRFTTAGTYNEVKDSYLSGFNKGVVSTAANEQWFFECDFEDCLAAGIEIAAGTASDGTTKISECDFISCGNGIKLVSGAAWVFSASTCNFYNTASGTDVGIFYNPTNFTNFNSLIITNNGWNNQGFFITGFDFTLASGRDANAYVMSNYGMEAKNPHFKISVLGNSGTTTVTTANTWYKCNWTNTSVQPCSWLISNNKATYLPANKKDVVMWISGNLSVNNSTRTISVAIIKNGVTGVRLGETSLRTLSSTSNQPFQFSTIVYLEDVSPGDYFELYCTSTTSADIVKIQNLNWFSDSK